MRIAVMVDVRVAVMVMASLGVGVRGGEVRVSRHFKGDVFSMDGKQGEGKVHWC